MVSCEADDVLEAETDFVEVIVEVVVFVDVELNESIHVAGVEREAVVVLVDVFDGVVDCVVRMLSMVSCLNSIGGVEPTSPIVNNTRSQRISF